MSNIETGGSAFPIDADLRPELDKLWMGMTLRQYYAAKALQGLLSGQWPDATDSKEIARRAFVLADFMVEVGK